MRMIAHGGAVRRSRPVAALNGRRTARGGVDAWRVRPGTRTLRRELRALFGGGECGGEGGALAGGALGEPDVAVHRAHDLAADVEAEAGAADLAGAGGFGAGEAAEEARLLGGGDAHALVADGDDDVGALGGGGDDVRGRGAGVLGGIVGVGGE